MRKNKVKQLKSDFPILIVEDNSVSRKYLENALKQAGYTVESVENGRKAFEIFNKKFFPFVLTDWMMPEMNGLDLCRAIRRKPNKRYVFIVLLTARDSKEDIINGLQAGADDYLTKPVNYAELIARLNSGMRILELEKNLREANKKIKILSITDPLTGCFNRGYMTKRLSQEIKRGMRYNHPLSVVFCDIDHFKEVNDTYGHQAGDYILKEFVRCILDTIRDELDWLSRYGGEEFLIVLPETNLDQAYRVAERIRKRIAQQEIIWKEEVIHLTASFGVTGIDNYEPEIEITPETLIQQADKNMYRSKQEGRNRTTATPLEGIRQ
jgi:two-component system cell cycle response regulator